MGWTTLYHCPEGIRAYVEKHLTWESETFSYRMLKSAMVGTTHYAAVEKTDKATGERIVFAAVTLTARNNSYKDMDESMGPCESTAPVSILDLLTPTESEWANQWRARCRANIERRAA